MELNEIKQMLDRIEGLRLQKGMSKSLMYELSSTSSSAMSQWRSGRTQPSQTSITALARVLDTTPEYLLYGIKKEPSLVQEGLTASEADIIRLYRSASPETQQAMLRFLRSLEADQLLRGGD